MPHKLIFDLNNINDMWSIVFIAEYIKENDILYKEYNKLKEEINTIENDLILIKNKHKSAKTKEEHNTINNEYQILNNILKTKKDLLDNNKKILDTFYNTNWVNLENENDNIKKIKSTKKLKQAINIIQKLRNSVNHMLRNCKEKYLKTYQS